MYVNDFSDKSEVDAVLREVRKIYSSSPTLYFKCDGVTHLGINSNNQWRLRVSCYVHKLNKTKPEEPISSSKVGNW